MNTFDLTKWLKPAMDTPCIHANDNFHEHWLFIDYQEEDSLFNYADIAAIRRMQFEVVR